MNQYLPENGTTIKPEEDNKPSCHPCLYCNSTGFAEISNPQMFIAKLKIPCPFCRKEEAEKWKAL